MSGARGPSSVREMLLAELIGDMQRLADQVAGLAQQLAQAEQSALAAAETLRRAGDTYREQVDDMLTRVRGEFAMLVTHTAEHAARSLLGEQAQVLERAALLAVREALAIDRRHRLRGEWLRGLGGGAAAGAVLGALVVAAVAWLLANP